LQPTTQLSVEAWVNTTDTGLVEVVRKRLYGYGIDLGGSAAGIPNFFIYDAGGQQRVASGAVSVNDGSWHQLVGTYDGSAVRLYVDGVLAGLSNASGPVYYQSGGIAIGRAGDWNGYYVGGSIDDVAIYGTAITSARVREHYQASGRTPASPPQSSSVYKSAIVHATPIGYWRMDETSGTTAFDSMGNGNDGVIQTGVTLGTGGALSASGDANPTMAFNGATGRIALSLQGLNTAAGASNTVEFWMYWTGDNLVMPFGFDQYDLYLANGSFGFNTGNTDDIWGISSAGLANQWVYVAATFYNGDPRQGALYINGEARQLTQRQGTSVTRMVSSMARIGAWPSGAGNNGPNGYPFTGSLDEVAIYDRALTSSQI
jgi:hypothetical protein